MSETIGFIGLGHLGLPLATNLLNAGYSLRVYNRTASKAEPLVAQGAQLVSRPVDAVTTGGIVATIVWDDAALGKRRHERWFFRAIGTRWYPSFDEHECCRKRQRSLRQCMLNMAVSMSRLPSLEDLRQLSPNSSGFLLQVHSKPKNASDHS